MSDYPKCASYLGFTIWLFNIAMENPHSINGCFSGKIIHKWTIFHDYHILSLAAFTKHPEISSSGVTYRLRRRARATKQLDVATCQRFQADLNGKPRRKMKQIHGQRLIMVYQLISIYIYICEYICGYVYIYIWTCKVEIQPELSAIFFKDYLGGKLHQWSNCHGTHLWPP